MSQEETRTLNEMVQIAKEKNTFKEIEDEQLETLFLDHRPTVYIIDKSGILYEYPLSLNQHHYVAYLAHLEYLNQFDSEKHKKFNYLFDIDLTSAQRVGSVITKKLGDYFHSLGNIVIQTWVNPYDMQACFMNTPLYLENENQCNTFYQLLESKDMNDAIEKENSRLGSLKVKPISIQKTK